MEAIEPSTAPVITSDGSYKKNWEKIWAGLEKKLEENTQVGS